MLTIEREIQCPTIRRDAKRARRLQKALKESKAKRIIRPEDIDWDKLQETAIGLSLYVLPFVMAAVGLLIERAGW